MTYTPHDPILITSNDNFVIGSNGVTSGSGTIGDPWIIENWSISAATAIGIDIKYTTDYFIIRNCLVEGGGYEYFGIFLDGVTHGRIENNTCQSDYGGIYLYATSDSTLTGNSCSNNDSYGIFLYSSSNNTLTNNTCSNSGEGIYLYYSDSNTLTGNTCLNNTSRGIYLDSSSNNTLTNNTCSNNSHGISVYYSDSNTLTGNTCLNNLMNGIRVRESSNNTMTLNYLLNNTDNNAYDEGTSSWDNGTHGNYWSDWQPPTHPDSDHNGIVDTPRGIDGGSNYDNFPLVIGWSGKVLGVVNPWKVAGVLTSYTSKVMGV